MNGKPSPILYGTNLDPQLLEIQVEEVAQSQYNNTVSTVTINNRLNPLFEASRACKNRRVSASSWLQGWSADKSPSKLFQRTSSKWVAMISTIFAGILVMLIASILNSSVLLSLFFKNT